MSIIAPQQFFTQAKAYDALSPRYMDSDIALLDPPTLSVVDSQHRTDESLHPKLRTNAFGRADLAATYRTAKDLIIKNKLFRIAQYSEVEGVRQLTICNIWRIERLPDSSIRTLECQLLTGVWEEVTSLEHWPEMPFFPIKQTKSLDWWVSIIRQAIWKALIAAGYFQLPRFLNEITHSQWKSFYGSDNPDSLKKEMTPGRMANRLIDRYLGRRKPGMLEPESMKAGARALRAAFFEHILDRDVFSAMLSINYKYSRFRAYLVYAQNRSGLLKVATEHRNLLPLLPSINPEHWGRDDLFSRKLWVRDGRKTTALDRRPLRCDRNGATGRPIRSFDIPAAWRWLSKTSSVIVREWSGRDNTIVANIALANIQVKAPVYAYVHVMRSSDRLERFGVSVTVQQLLRCYLAHCADMWRDQGHTAVRLWLRDNRQSSISDMLDYLDAEGFEAGFPNKKSTWASLLRRSEDWHRRVAIEGIENNLRGAKMLEWTSLLLEATLDDVVFTSLNDSRALAVEGYEMDHCVGQYAGYCHRGTYRVYSAKELDGTRSTLGFAIRGKRVIWDQHQGKYRATLSPLVVKAGKQIALLYQQALSDARAKSK